VEVDFHQEAEEEVHSVVVEAEASDKLLKIKLKNILIFDRIKVK
jgi:hypothetical protein